MLQPSLELFGTGAVQVHIPQPSVLPLPYFRTHSERLPIRDTVLPMLKHFIRSHFVVSFRLRIFNTILHKREEDESNIFQYRAMMGTTLKPFSRYYPNNIPTVSLQPSWGIRVIDLWVLARELSFTVHRAVCSTPSRRILLVLNYVPCLGALLHFHSSSPLAPPARKFLTVISSNPSG